MDSQGSLPPSHWDVLPGMGCCLMLLSLFWGQERQRPSIEG